MMDGTKLPAAASQVKGRRKEGPSRKYLGNDDARDDEYPMVFHYPEENDGEAEERDREGRKGERQNYPRMSTSLQIPSCLSHQDEEMRGNRLLRDIISNQLYINSTQ